VFNSQYWKKKKNPTCEMQVKNDKYHIVCLICGIQSYIYIYVYIHIHNDRNVKGDCWEMGQVSGGRAKGEGDGGMNMHKVHYMHVWKCIIHTSNK
jgi:hypothetical protein